MAMSDILLPINMGTSEGMEFQSAPKVQPLPEGSSVFAQCAGEVPRGKAYDEKHATEGFQRKQHNM